MTPDRLGLLAANFPIKLRVLWLAVLGFALVACAGDRSSAVLPDLAENGLIPCKETSLSDDSLLAYQGALNAFSQAIKNDGYARAGTRFPSNIIYDGDVEAALSAIQEQLILQGFVSIETSWLSNHPGWRTVYVAKHDDVYFLGVRDLAVSENQFLSVSLSTLYPPDTSPLVPDSVSAFCQ